MHRARKSTLRVLIHENPSKHCECSGWGLVQWRALPSLSEAPGSIPSRRALTSPGLVKEMHGASLFHDGVDLVGKTFEEQTSQSGG